MGKKPKNGSIIIISDKPLGRIEDSLRGFLGSYPGTWRVRINQRLTGGWWSVMALTEGFHRILLLRPDEHHADAIIGQLREALNPGAPPPPPWDGRERRSRPRS